MSVECLDRLQAPGLPLASLCLGPAYRFPIGGEDQPCTCIRQFNPIAGRFPDIEKEGSLNGVFMRPLLDMDAILQENIGCPQNVFALIGGIGDMMQPPFAATMFFGAGQIVTLVIDREPAPAQTAIIQLDVFGHTRAKACFHEAPELGDIFRKQVEVIQPPWGRPGEGAGRVLQGRPFGTFRCGTTGIIVYLEHMAEGIFKLESRPVRHVAIGPSMHTEA